MRHKPERPNEDTYHGGLFLYRHYVLASSDIDGTWRYVGDVFDRSLDAAQAQVRAMNEVSRVWTDNEKE